MNNYVVIKKIVTPAKFSVDGKRHIRANYFKDFSSTMFGDMINWCGTKKEAHIFTNKAEAIKIAKKYNGEVVRVN